MKFHKLFALVAAFLMCVASNHVQALTPPTFITSWDSPFTSPWGVAVDRLGFVYVADPGTNMIYKFHPNGLPVITSWGGSGSGNGQFADPRYIAVDSSNNVYVTDTGNSRVQKFDSNGNYISQFGSLGSADNQFNTPQGIGIDSLGNIFVVDTGNQVVKKFDSSGNFLAKTAGSNFGWYGLAVDTNNTIYVNDAFTGEVFIFDSSLNPGVPPNFGTGIFNFDVGVATDSSNNVYVTNNGGGGGTGAYIFSPPLFTSPIVFGNSGPNAFVTPFGDAVSGANNIYVVDQGTTPPNVSLWGTVADAAQSTLVANPTSVKADGTSTSTITATLKDSSGNPVSGKAVSLAASGGSSVISAPSGVSNAAGQVTFTVKDSTAETVTYTATDTTDSVTITQTAQVTFTSPVPPVPPPPPPAPAPQPPTNVKGILSKSEFATQTDIINTITWSPAPDSFVEGYIVFQGVLQVAEVPAKGPYVVTLHNRKKGPNTYTIVSFNSQGTYSAPITVTIP